MILDPNLKQQDITQRRAQSQKLRPGCSYRRRYAHTDVFAVFEQGTDILQHNETHVLDIL